MVEQTLLDPMLRNGIPLTQARELRWVQIVPVLAQATRVRTVALGRKLIKLRPKVYKRLEREFRERVTRRGDLQSLLRSHIAS